VQVPANAHLFTHDPATFDEPNAMCIWRSRKSAHFCVAYELLLLRRQQRQPLTPFEQRAWADLLVAKINATFTVREIRIVWMMIIKILNVSDGIRVPVMIIDGFVRFCDVRIWVERFWVERFWVVE